MAATVKTIREALNESLDGGLYPEKLDALLKRVQSQVKTTQDVPPFLKKFYDPMIAEIDQVYENIYIANYKGAMDLDRQRSLGITDVINTASADVIYGLPKIETDEAIQLHDIYINDYSTLEDCDEHVRVLKSVADLMQNIFLNKKDAKVMVNCAAGCSRSSSCVLAFLVLYKDLPITEAIRIVRSRRKTVPNYAFMASLAKIHNEKFHFEVDCVADAEKNAHDLMMEHVTAIYKLFVAENTPKSQ